MNDFIIELIKVPVWAVAFWCVVFIGGVIYGINKKIGIILAVITGAVVTTFIVWGSIFIIPTMAANDFHWGSALGGGIGGAGFVPISSKGIKVGEFIKKVFE